MGIIGAYTFVDWGKRRNTILERELFIGMANQKVSATQDEVRQKALKACREFNQTQEAIKLAGELVQARTEAAGAAAKDIHDQLKAGKDLMEAQLGFLKANLAHRFAYVNLMSIIGQQ